ncbi:MAG: membrane dipeptidase [Anaerolineaceae bacterium]|nr:membrane dipeptidase [Anaerolineaceae bacterium]
MKYLCADAHLDLAYDVVRKRSMGQRRVLEHDYAPDMQAAGLCLVISSIYLEDDEIAGSALEAGLEQVEALLEDISESPSFFLIERKPDLEKLAENKTGILLCFEGAEPVGKKLSMLSIFRRLGLSGAGLVWSRPNLLGAGSALHGEVCADEPGLTPFGRTFIQEAARQSIFIDLAHLNDCGFWDAVKESAQPLMLSHGGCRALNPIARNSSDAQLKAIIASDGFIGINAINFILSDGKKIRENIYGYITHLKHVLTLGGEDNLGFGFDFNDQILAYVSGEHLASLPRLPFDCVKGYKQLPLLLEAMAEQGFTESQINKISSTNLIRFLRKVLPEK